MNFKTMKKLFYLIFTSLVYVAGVAQAVEEPQPHPESNRDENAKDKIKAARIGLITQRLNLTPEQAEKFWPI